MLCTMYLYISVQVSTVNYEWNDDFCACRRPMGHLFFSSFHMSFSLFCVNYSCCILFYMGSMFIYISLYTMDPCNKDYYYYYYYNDVVMSVMASQITGVSIVYSTVCSGADQRKHQSSASLALVRGIHRWPMNSSHKGPVTGKCFHLMTSSWKTRRLWKGWDICLDKLNSGLVMQGFRKSHKKPQCC